MADAASYPVTLGYKATSPPYGTVAHPYHKGIDYGCPTGTPVVVNEVQIGLSGATGWVDGPHLHVGRFMNGQDTNPAGGFSFKSAVVTEIHTVDDNVDGKYVRVQGDGASWVYLHLSQVNVSVGQVLQGDTMDKITKDEENSLAIMATGSYPGKDYNYQFTGQPLTQGNLDKMLQFWQSQTVNRPAPGATVLSPGTYQVK